MRCAVEVEGGGAAQLPRTRDSRALIRPRRERHRVSTSHPSGDNAPGSTEVSRAQTEAERRTCPSGERRGGQAWNSAQRRCGDVCGRRRMNSTHLSGKREEMRISCAFASHTNDGGNTQTARPPHNNASSFHITPPHGPPHHLITSKYTPQATPRFDDLQGITV